MSNANAAAAASARRASKGSVQIGQESAAFSGQSTSQAAYGGHWGCKAAAPSNAPAAQGGKKKELGPMSTSGCKFEGGSSMKAAFAATGAQPRPRSSMKQKASGLALFGNGTADPADGQSTARAAYGGSKAQGGRRQSLKREQELHTQRDAHFEGESTQHADFRGAKGSVRHPKTSARTDHVHLVDDGKQEPQESVAHHDFVYKVGARPAAATTAQVDHVRIGDSSHYDAKIDSASHEAYHGVQAAQLPAATNARLDHVEIGDSHHYEKDVHSAAHDAYKGERGEPRVPCTAAREDHVHISDGSSAQRRGSIMSTAYAE